MTPNRMATRTGTIPTTDGVLTHEEPEVRFAPTAPAYRLAGMEGGLDAARRLVPVARLVREGLLVIET